jgi:hypothetical protein
MRYAIERSACTPPRGHTVRDIDCEYTRHKHAHVCRVEAPHQHARLCRLEAHAYAHGEVSPNTYPCQCKPRTCSSAQLNAGLPAIIDTIWRGRKSFCGNFTSQPKRTPIPQTPLNGGTVSARHGIRQMRVWFVSHTKYMRRHAVEARGFPEIHAFIHTDAYGTRLNSRFMQD